MRRGSALLIVLGMLAFMVTSAVGFAIYMREGRVPSSHLRRESTARYLLKSALANAIAGIDGTYSGTDGGFIGVYDDVYPGVSSGISLTVNDNGGYFSHRVFSPFGEVDPSTTVSTLTLEGLAYLPPAIINEVRVFSRMTRTAMWHNLAYDLGRYAFCAVDVSDCFDINKVYAGERRSSAPGARVNLSSLYPNGGSAIDNLFDAAGNVPFVSMADFNVAAGQSAYTPFMKYIGTTGSKIYTTSDADAVSNALFIAESWFPETNQYLNANLELKTRSTGVTVYDLALGTSGGSGDRKPAQPFNNYDVNSFLYTSDQTPVTKQNGLFLGNLGGVGLACLYDYLDGDSVPVTLALPTVEAVPMVCGFSLVGAGGGLNPKFELNGTPVSDFTYKKTEADGQEHTFKRTIKRYDFKGANGFNQAAVSGTVLYPFKRLKATGRQAGKSFTVETLVGMFYADAGLTARATADAFRPAPSLWSNPKPANGVCWFKGTGSKLTLPDDLCGADAEQKAVLQFVINMQAPSSTDQPVCFLVHDDDVTPQDTDGNPTHVTHQDILTTDSLSGNADRFRPFTAAGAEGGTFGKKPLYGASDIANGREQDAITDTSSYNLHYAVWLRVVDNESKTVDLVPAVFADDENWLDGCTYGALAENKQLTALCGENKPLLAFRADATTAFKYDTATIDALDGTKQTAFENFKALYAPDPRYNFAPEDWKGVMTEYNAVTDWKDNTTGYLGGTDRDRDLFLFVSDQEYLQSIGELQFLPFVQPLGRNTSFLNCDFANSARYNGVVGSGANAARYWKSYTAISGNDVDRNPFFDLLDNGKPVEVVSGTGDFRVNPFSRDARILKAAVVDTPYDYYVASTNAQLNLKANMNQSQARQLAFGPNGTCGSWDADESDDIANALRNAFMRAANKGLLDFTEAMSDLNWDETERTRLFGITEPLADPLHDVDRKFLFSYWRECFQNRQQLFLVFIRAEPLTVGGSTGDAIANAQLGARGVALVWRDPAPPVSKGEPRKIRTALSSRTAWRDQCEHSGPHRTRVLFYHQFD